MGKSLTGHACHIYLGFHINGSSFTVNRIACLKEMSPLDFTDNLKTLSKSFTNGSMKIIITEFHIFYFRIGCSGALLINQYAHFHTIHPTIFWLFKIDMNSAFLRSLNL